MNWKRYRQELLPKKSGYLGEGSAGMVLAAQACEHEFKFRTYIKKLGVVCVWELGGFLSLESQPDLHT